MRARAVVIMAAGMGTRMKSEKVKVLHKVAGFPLIGWCVRTALSLSAERVVLVLGHQHEKVEEFLDQTFQNAPLVYAFQAEQLGTAHAVSCAEEALHDFEGDVFILSGDVPGLTAETLEAFDAACGDADLGVMGMRLSSGGAYGRLVCDADELQKIVEARDCTSEELKICDVNSGIYRVNARFLFAALKRFSRNNAQGEYYLTDLVAAARAEHRKVCAHLLEGEAAEELEGINDRIDLAKAEKRMQQRLKKALMRQGVTMIDPDRLYVEAQVTAGSDCLLEPDVSLRGQTHLGRGCVIGQGAIIIDSSLDEGTYIKPYSHIEGAQIGPECQVGPFARLRPGTVFERDVRVGNFVETKKSHLFEGVKAGHLSYLGDAEVGPRCNIGAGTITCNYDGHNKHPTRIGADVFIGSDSQLVAPVCVEEGAYVGAGTTVTGLVPAGALAISRTPQKNLEGWVARHKK